MRLVLQRVKWAQVRVGGEVVGRIGPGLLALVGIARGDTHESGRLLAEKTVHLRVFEDEHGKMNHSLLDGRGAVLCVSQFTLYGDCRKGRRPSYDRAAPPDEALLLYNAFLNAVREYGVPVESGRFQTMMEVELVNDGPVTLLLDSEKIF